MLALRKFAAFNNSAVPVQLADVRFWDRRRRQPEHDFSGESPAAKVTLDPNIQRINTFDTFGFDWRDGHHVLFANGFEFNK